MTHPAAPAPACAPAPLPLPLSFSAAVAALAVAADAVGLHVGLDKIDLFFDLVIAFDAYAVVVRHQTIPDYHHLLVDWT